MKFTDSFIKSLKPQEKKLYVREARGFAIRVLPSGVKTWLYIFTFEGKRTEMNLGHYPAVSLSDARTKYNEAYELLKRGINPAELAETEKEERRKALTVADLIEEFIEKYVKKRKVDRSVYDDTRTLNKDVLPAWGRLKAKDVRRRDAILLLEDIAERAPGQARNVLKVTRKMFNFALEREVVELNPFTGITAATIPGIAPQKGTRVLNSEEVRRVWEKLEDPTLSGSSEIRRCLKLILVTGQRPGEVIGMHRREIDGRWWTIPGARTKNDRDHRVYLTNTALELIGGAGEYVFPSPKGDGAMRENALAHMLRDNFYFPLKASNGKPMLGEDGKPKTENLLGVEHFVPHDLRRTCRTFLAAIGIHGDHAEAILNHKKQGVEAVYNLYEYDKEKQAALEKWERKLLDIVTGETGRPEGR